ncbi:MAG: hypothetical protein ACOYXC_09120 [Candidatus Rifleibacteriota bacterium]
MNPLDDPRVIQFHSQMNSMDELALVVLKGHLILEECLSRIIKQHVFNEEYIDTADLSFFKKIQIAKSFALRKDKIDIWELIQKINTLRNQIAHNLEYDKRQKVFEGLKSQFLKTSKKDFPEIDFDKARNDEVFYLICANCYGFLLSFEDDGKAFKSMVKSIDDLINEKKEN